MTDRFAVIGDPVAHSRSPAMHRAAYRALGIDATYDAVRVGPGELVAFLGGAADAGYRGLNVTLPHKSAVIPWLTEITERASRIGAVNTITVRGAGLRGDNTDGAGLVRSLTEAGFDARGARIVVLGAGGAARAAAVGLSDAGARAVRVAARRPGAATRLAAESTAAGAAGITGHGFEELGTLFGDTDLVVQATSATLEGSATATAFAAALPLEALAASATVIDLVYQPLETTVLAAARARGLTAIDGLGMLVHQGALALEAWLGVDAPVEAMRAALR